MACPTCGNALLVRLTNDLRFSNDVDTMALCSCRRCGTIVIYRNGVAYEEIVPELVNRVIAFAGKLTEEHQDLIDEFERLGIREAIMVDEGMI